MILKAPQTFAMVTQPVLINRVLTHRLVTRVRVITDLKELDLKEIVSFARVCKRIQLLMIGKLTVSTVFQTPVLYLVLVFVTVLQVMMARTHGLVARVQTM